VWGDGGTHRPLVGIRGSGELTGPTTDREWGLGAMGRWGGGEVGCEGCGECEE